ncbi:protein of unknown function [Actinokineospora alba]|uniref:DUF4386 domain-containing protein n=1 Tax=Actinokineospora alba TaxID=504798 RepID=A0A1H0QZ06_9PSEU|nr:DUF4386 domain-containing protein [Actinokineospora alba]TDP70330.1 uncharacterized protein DUF4386 [Actinokineospora alba]SDI33988.1 protein of unknown function [Actinokineospora alba]SDP22400.1 protein of unknown function [Actinokineospora alba]
MSSTRTTAVTAGVFFLITEITAIAGMALYQPILADPNHPGGDGRVLLGGLFELLLVAAVIGSAVTLYPVVKRQNHGLALGYVCARLLEAAIIVVGTISVLSVVTLRQDMAGADNVVSKALLAIHEWAFLLGPNFVLGANSLMLAALMYRSRLVPRAIAVLGLIGGPLICVSATAVLFGLYEQLSPVGALAALPVFAWEVSLALYLIIKGFRRAAPTATLPH